MMEWVILLLIVPAIVVPVVLLLGFAGCDVLLGLDEVTPGPPLILSVTGTGATTITVVWKYDDATANFQVERTKEGVADPLVDEPSTTFEDRNLEEGTNYSYRVRAVFSNGDPTDWSAPVTGTTLSFQLAFAATLTEKESGWETYCVVQRIEPPLFHSGKEVKITIRASPDGDLTIDRIFISKPAAGGDPYDADDDLKEVASSVMPVMVPAGTAITLPTVNYDLDSTQPLLIAFDFSSTVGSGNVAYAIAQPSEASVYYKHAFEAAINDRQGFFEQGTFIFMVEKIEVA
jgi:hypothetical protein